MIQNELKKLRNLMTVESCSKLLLAACNNLDKINPYDYCFKNIGLKFNILGNNTLDYKLLCKYMINTAS